MNNQKEKGLSSRVAELVYIPVAITISVGIILLFIEFRIFQPPSNESPAATPEPPSTIICSFVGDDIEVNIEDYNCYSSDFEFEEAVLQNMVKEGLRFNPEGSPVQLPALISDVQDARSLNNLISRDRGGSAASGSPMTSSVYAKGTAPEFARLHNDGISKVAKSSGSSKSGQIDRLNFHSTRSSNGSLSGKLVAEAAKSPSPLPTSEHPVDQRFPVVTTPPGVPSTPTPNPFISRPPVPIPDRQPLLALLIFPIYFLGKRVVRARFFRL